MNKNTKVILGIGCSVFVVFALVCGGLFGGLAIFGIGMAKELNQSTDSFLAQIGTGDIKGAYDSAATPLRQQQTLDQFKASVTKLGLTEYQSSSWSKWNRVNNEAVMEGSITTKSGGTVPLVVTLLKEGDAWKVSAITAPGAGVTTPAEKKPVPSDDELKVLVRTTITDFDKAVKKGDFTEFHGTIAEFWKREATPADLNKAFKEFIDRKIACDVTGKDPVFDTKPAVNADGNLELSGYFATQPLRTIFKLKYTYEHPKWKLIGLNVKKDE